MPKLEFCEERASLSENGLQDFLILFSKITRLLHSCRKTIDVNHDDRKNNTKSPNLLNPCTRNTAIKHLLIRKFSFETKDLNYERPQL